MYSNVTVWYDTGKDDGVRGLGRLGCRCVLMEKKREVRKEVGHTSGEEDRL